MLRYVTILVVLLECVVVLTTDGSNKGGQVRDNELRQRNTLQRLPTKQCDVVFISLSFLSILNAAVMNSVIFAPSFDVHNCLLRPITQTTVVYLQTFLPAMHKRGLCRHAVSLCLYVCLSRLWIMSKRIIFEIFSPGSHTIVVFLY